MDFDERVPPKTKIPELFKLVDDHEKVFIQSLREAVSIPSISGCSDHFDDVMKMLKLCSENLEALGALVEVIDGNDNNNDNLPPVLFANLFSDDDYKTICVYGNIDVLSPRNPESFEMEEKDGRLFGCGISDNKAPFYCWINAIKIYRMSKNEIPVNIKFVVEGTSEQESPSLCNAIKKNREFFNNVEYICLTIDKKTSLEPCLKYGYRGLCHFSIKISCGDKRVHGGTYGGAFNQPLLDAVNITGSLIDKKTGKIAVTEFLKDVKPLTEIDYKLINKEICNVDCLKLMAGITSLSHKEIPSRIIIHKTRLPSISINAFHIKSAPADRNDCASIPNKIDARFSVRLVPNQTVLRTHRQFENYIEKMWNRYKSNNTYSLKLRIGFDPWQEDPLSDHYEAAAAAIKSVYKVSPKYLCEGSTMPVVSIFSSTCPASSIIVMPISEEDHSSISESISISDYLSGVKLAIAYMCEVHELDFK